MRLLIAGTILLGVALGLAACGSDDNGGTDPSPTVTVDFDPAPGALTVGTFEDFVFAATVQNASADSAHFYVDDVLSGQIVGEQVPLSFPFQRTQEGEFLVRFEIHVGDDVYRGEWDVTVTTDTVPLPPVVDALQVESGDLPGSLEVIWLAPGESRYVVPLAEYVVAWSTSPILPDDFDTLPYLTIAHRTDVITQRAEITGLPERVLHYVAVRVRDVLDRVSPPSDAVATESTGHFDATGVIRTVELEAGTTVEPVVNVLVEIDGHKTLTATDGRFSLVGLPDLRSNPLIAEEESGAIYYAIVTSPLDPITFDLNLLLFPRGVIELELEPGGAVMTTLDYVLDMTKNSGALDDDFQFHPWAEYPIPVYVHDYVYEPSDVDYGLAFSNAVANWNAAVNEEILRLEFVTEAPVRSDPLTGLFYAPDLVPQGSGNLGQVEVVRPQGGDLYQVAPEWLVVRLRSNFFTQEVADYVVTHELGHVLGLDHSPSRRDIMFFAVNTSRGLLPSASEAFVARFLKNVGPGIDSTWYSVPGSVR